MYGCAVVPNKSWGRYYFNFSPFLYLARRQQRLILKHDTQLVMIKWPYNQDLEVFL